MAHVERGDVGRVIITTRSRMSGSRLSPIRCDTILQRSFAHPKRAQSTIDELMDGLSFIYQAVAS